MKTKFLMTVLTVSIVCISFLISCAKVPKVKLPEVTPVAGPLSQIIISPNTPKTTVGGTVVLTAVGYDAQGRKVEINPTWKCGPEGKVEPTVGKQVIFTGLKPGVCYVEVFEGNVSGITAVEIK